MSGAPSALEQFKEARKGRPGQYEEKYQQLSYYRQSGTQEARLKDGIGDWFTTLIDNVDHLEDKRLYSSCWCLLQNGLLVCNPQGRVKVDGLCDALDLNFNLAPLEKLAGLLATSTSQTTGHDPEPYRPSLPLAKEQRDATLEPPNARPSSDTARTEVAYSSDRKGSQGSQQATGQGSRWQGISRNRIDPKDETAKIQPRPQPAEANRGPSTDAERAGEAFSSNLGMTTHPSKPKLGPLPQAVNRESMSSHGRLSELQVSSPTSVGHPQRETNGALPANDRTPNCKQALKNWDGEVAAKLIGPDTITQAVGLTRSALQRPGTGVACAKEPQSYGSPQPCFEPYTLETSPFHWRATPRTSLFFISPAFVLETPCHPE